MFRPLQHFGFDKELVYAYTNGQCWYLTQALMEKAGLEPVAFWAEGLIYHVGVALPDNTVVDVLGVWERETWMRKWKQIMMEITSRDIKDVRLGEVSSEDEYWMLATCRYAIENMLNEELYLSQTLDQLSNAILGSLAFSSRLPQLQSV